jgi:hypothetical protein
VTVFGSSACLVVRHCMCWRKGCGMLHLVVQHLGAGAGEANKAGRMA